MEACNLSEAGKRRWFEAIASGDIHTARILLEASKGVVHIRNNDGDTALHTAVKNKHISLVKFLLSAGADANLTGKEELFPLQNAAWGGDLEITSLLIPVTYSIDARNSGRTLSPLQWAIAGGHIEIAKLLLDAGADIEIRHYRSTPLHTAVVSNKKAAVHLLIERGANIDTPGDNENTPLGWAVLFGWMDMVETLLAYGANIHAKQELGQSLLGLALTGGLTNWDSLFQEVKGGCIRLLLEKGAIISPEEDQKNPFIYQFIEKGYPLDLIPGLVKAGISINKTDDSKSTPLLKAIREGKEDTAVALINAGADICPQGEKYWRSFLFASVKKQSRVLNAIMQKGGFAGAAAAIRLNRLDVLENIRGLNINSQELFGKATLLHYAASWNRPKIAQWLLAEGANPLLRNGAGAIPFPTPVQNKYNDIHEQFEKNVANDNIQAEWFTSLYCAVCDRNLELVKYLIACGVDIDAVSFNGLTPLHAAVKLGYGHIVKYLVEHGADIEKLYKPNGATALHFAAAHGYEGIIKILIQHGADFNATSKNCIFTALHVAVINQQESAVRCLIEHGADISKGIYEDPSISPLYWAIDKGHEDIAKCLLEQGEYIEIDSETMTKCLFTATEKGLEGVVRYFVEKTADINKAYEGKTVLHVATCAGHANLVKYLVEAGADYTMVSKDKETPLSIALHKGHKEIVTYLRDLGNKASSHSVPCSSKEQLSS